MALLYFCLISLFCTLNASILRTEFQNVGRTRDAASDYCERTYYRGYLAPWQEIVNTWTGSLQIWDGNSYQLSPLITILGCTNDTGSSHHTIPATLDWSRAAAQCQGMCRTTVFAIRGTDCHCLGESYIPANDIDCIPMIARSPNLNSQNRNAKTVFKTVSLGINGPSTDRCLAQNNSNGCNYEFRSCSESLTMMCKDSVLTAGTTVPDSWQEAAYSCTSSNSFPRPVSDVCITDAAGNTDWYGGFRLLQYIPGSTDGTFCKRLSYSTKYAAPTLKEVSCDSTFRFYCRYTESVYNEPCDVTIPTSCNVNFICSDRTGAPKCLCTGDKYWDDTNRICRTRRLYGNSCDTRLPDVCADGLSCQSSGGSYTCHCKENRYLDPKSVTCEPKHGYNQTCPPGFTDSCVGNLICKSDEAKCGCLDHEYYEQISEDCLEMLTYGGDCLEDKQCSPGLTCSVTSSEGGRKCFCVAGSYWDKTTSSCFVSKSYGQLCNTTVEDICQRTMVCQPRAGRNVCVCDNKHHWDGEAFVCQPVTTDISDKASCSIICTSNTSPESTSDTQRYRVMLIIFMVVDALMTIGFVAMFVYVVRLRLQRPRATT